MRRFEYLRPTTLDEATGFLEAHADDARVLAGGTALVSLLAQGLLRPAYLVDLNGLSVLRGISNTNGSLRIGALTHIATLHRDPQVAKAYPLLAEAAAQVASIRVRNVATVGGSCSYGEPQTDLPPALIAMGARVHLAGATGDRWLSLEDFFLGPYETVLEPGELLTELEVLAPSRGAGGSHQKFTVGSAANKPVANVSCFLRLEGGRVAEARIVMGAVGGVPTLATSAAEALLGQQPTEGVIAAAAAKASEEADPIEDLRGSIWYKRRMVRVLTERGLRSALERSG